MAVTTAVSAAAPRPPRWRFDVQLTSPDVLAGFMELRGYTVRSLAEEVHCSSAKIGHLRSGWQTTCKPALALAIEKALKAPKGVLFTPRVTTPAGVGRMPTATKGRLR